MFVNASVSRIKGLTVYLNLLEDLNELYTEVSLVVDLNDKNEYDFDVVRRTINTCRLFKDATYEPVVQYLYKLFLNSGNFPTACPIKKVIFLFVNTELLRSFVQKFPYRAFTISKIWKAIPRIFQKWCPKRKQCWRSNICPRKIKKWNFWFITKYILRSKRCAE